MEFLVAFVTYASDGSLDYLIDLPAEALGQAAVEEVRAVYPDWPISAISNLVGPVRKKAVYIDVPEADANALPIFANSSTATVTIRPARAFNDYVLEEWEMVCTKDVYPPVPEWCMVKWYRRIDVDAILADWIAAGAPEVWDV